MNTYQITETRNCNVFVTDLIEVKSRVIESGQIVSKTNVFDVISIGSSPIAFYVTAKEITTGEVRIFDQAFYSVIDKETIRY